MAGGASERGGGPRGPGALGVQVPRPSGIAAAGPNRDAAGDRRARERHRPALYWPRRGAWLAPIGWRDSTFRFSEPRLLGVAHAAGGACAGGAAQGGEVSAGACQEFREQRAGPGQRRTRPRTPSLTCGPVPTHDAPRHEVSVFPVPGVHLFAICCLLVISS